jgi:hypothetical protein
VRLTGHVLYVVVGTWVQLFSSELGVVGPVWLGVGEASVPYGPEVRKQ